MVLKYESSLNKDSYMDIKQFLLYLEQMEEIFKDNNISKQLKEGSQNLLKNKNNSLPKLMEPVI